MVVNDEQAIRALVERWMTASAAGDIETVLGLMTDDVVFSVPGQEPFGKEAFAAASQGMAGVTIDGTSEIVELQVNGDWAFIRNHIRLAITPRDASVVRRSGYTLSILRKGTDGQWRIARDANMVTTEPSRG
ncbi:MAG: YybH family protein [Thermomicrobiales bacterium]